MAIKTDTENAQTLCTCDRCGTLSVTASADGRAPEGWGTGQLWIDVTLSRQTHVALCFCEDCFAAVLDAPALTLQVAAGED